MNGRSQEFIDDRFPVSHSSGQQTDKKCDKKSKADAGKGEPDGTPEIGGNNKCGKRMQCIRRAYKQDMIVDHGGAELP